jgi:ABC-type multidrug transport system permease subunit
MDLATPLMKPGIDPSCSPKDQMPAFPLLNINKNFQEIISALMAALMSVLVLCLVDVLMDVLLSSVLVCMFVLVICMATHFEFTSVFL